MDVRHVFRRGNLLIARAARDGPDDPVSFICECETDWCLETIVMTPREFRSLTAERSRFVVLDGHEEPDDEDVVGQGPGYTVVESMSSAYPETRRVNAG
jgi:hypothetical protein